MAMHTTVNRALRNPTSLIGPAERPRRLALSVAFLTAFACGVATHSAAAATKERLDVEIDSRPYALEIVTERPEGDVPDGGWPIALITHGAAGSSPYQSVGPDLLDRWVRFFSGRGYYAVAVARRGYATSDGPVVGTDDTCAEPRLRSWIDGQSDDLVATLDRIGERPEADAERIIAIGQSAGGAAVLGLNGRVEGLAAIINAAGGVFHMEPGAPAARYAVFDGCERYRQALIESIGQYGARDDTPSLWIYANNDEYFDTELVGEMARAWHASGAAPEPVLAILPGSEDSHRLFIWDEGPSDMKASIDRFLDEHGLPADRPGLADDLERCLPFELRAFAQGYLEEQNHKALAISGDGERLYYEDSMFSAPAAREEALSMCSSRNGTGCRLLAEDARLDTAACPGTGASG